MVSVRDPRMYRLPDLRKNDARARYSEDHVQERQHGVVLQTGTSELDLGNARETTIVLNEEEQKKDDDVRLRKIEKWDCFTTLGPPRNTAAALVTGSPMLLGDADAVSACGRRNHPSDSVLGLLGQKGRSEEVHERARRERS